MYLIICYKYIIYFFLEVGGGKKMSNHIDDILNSINHEDKKEIEQLLKDREVNQDIDNKQSIIDTYNQFSSPKENSVFIQKLQQMQNRIEKVKDTGVRNRAITDFNEKDIKSHNKFPGEDHPIFEHFFQLANKYPNRDFLISSIMNKIKEKQNKIDIKIKYSLEDIETLKDIELYKITNPKHWQDDLSDEVINLYNHTNIDTINLQIQQLNEKKENIDDWKRIKNGIRISDISTTKKIKDNLYYNIMGEFDKLFEFCTNVGGIMEYRAKIPVKTFTPIDVHSALASELEKQIGLCEEPCTHNFFYSDGEGRLIPFEINRDILYYIHENTTFIKFNKKNPEYRDGRIINSDALFKNVPKFVNKVQYKNLNLVGFNNKFYNVKSGKLQPLNAYAPILPLKNCNTELYLHRNIDDDIITQNDNERIINVDNIIPIEYNPMEHIFNECFSEIDRNALLAYIGCCLYDKGYTSRQESIFLMSKGGTGKSTLVKAICQIFYKSDSQLVNQLGERFGFSIFADNDCVIIDEIQQAKKEFANILKDISTGSNMPIEKKYVDGFSLPAENIPRVWFIGNQFPTVLYYLSNSPGVSRRILCIVPIKPIQDLGYTYDQITTDSCKQWLVQQATLEYMRQGLHLDDKSPIQVDNTIKEQRIEMCTFPEKYFIEKHFELVYNDDNVLDMDEFVYYDEMHDFIYECIIDNMLEPTVKKGVSQTFINNFKEAFGLTNANYHTSKYRNRIKMKGVKPKTNKAIDFFNKCNIDE